MQKIGFEEEIFVVDLKNLKVYKGEQYIVWCFAVKSTCFANIWLIRIVRCVSSANLGMSLGDCMWRMVMFWSGMAGKAEGKPDATFSFVDGDFIAVSSGKMNPQMAFIRCDYLNLVLLSTLLQRQKCFRPLWQSLFLLWRYYWGVHDGGLEFVFYKSWLSEGLLCIS